jgi:superfamily II DNA or RNA helicase
MRFAAGDHVKVRGTRWVVDEMTTFGDCALLSLSALAPVHDARTCRLLLPFDRPVKLTGRVRAQVMAPRKWLQTLSGTLSRLRAFGQLRGAPRAAIDVLPFQLEPAIALVAGRASRFLLADEVGLGKTIQAGLMLAELQQRGWCERALILTPAGLRRQWADELERRFQIRAAIVDAPALSRLTGALPHDVNPWTVEPVAIASIDFVKQPEVLRGLRAQLWDMLVVDEAHQASVASRRYDAVQMLARRARHVVLLTATPHAGDDAAYAALCNLGRVFGDDPLVLFRRTRRQAGLERRRRVHLLGVALTARTLEMHRRLDTYLTRLWSIAGVRGRRDVQLTATVLSKRALSSAGALHASIERRLALLSGHAAPSQPALPFDADDDRSDEPPDGASAAFEDLDEERRVLVQILEAASAAVDEEPKISALRRLLRRVREPVVVFTEYRDTLDRLQRALGGSRAIATLHGGKSPQDRRDAVAAFTRGGVDLLLATDVGAEGLNLHERCRLVVNLELPWNPIRLEQRVGRVDRIGQQRTVHAVNLMARDTAEADVLARLVMRVDRIQASEIEIAESVIARAPLPPPQLDVLPEHHTERCDVAGRATAEAMRVQAVRRACSPLSDAPEGTVPCTLLRSVRSGSLALRSLDQRVIWFVLVRIANGAGRLIEEAMVPVATAAPRRSRLKDLRPVLKGALTAQASPITEAVASIARERALALDRDCAGWSARALARERQLREAAVDDTGGLIQPGLFDGRAVKTRQLADEDRRIVSGASLARTTLLDAAGTAVIASPPEIAFVLLVQLGGRRASTC